MVLVVLMGGAILLQAALEGFTLLRVVQTTAVLSGLVPYGLFFLIALAYTAGAVTSSRRGALVQRVNAVESVSNVDVVCTDKTGTLTTGRSRWTSVTPVGADDAATVTAALGSMARSTDAPNLTTQALAAAPPRASRCRCGTRSPFTSALRWSALQTDDADLGARRSGGAGSRAARAGPRAAGARPRPRRACGSSSSPGPPTPACRCAAPDGAPGLPALEPLAVVALADELRPDVPETLARFRQEGIGLKVLSGDDPDTVAALASRAGLEDTSPVHAGNLHELSDAELDPVVGRGSSSAGWRPSRRNGSSCRCAGRAATSPWSATA